MQLGSEVSASDHSILVERPRAGVVVITLNRPEVHNALDDTVIGAVARALDAVAVAGDARIIVFRGAGPSFCSGADARWICNGPDQSLAENVAVQVMLPRVLEQLRALPQLTVALVHGAVRGGGVGLVATCDVALMERDAHLAINEIRLGFMPSTIAPHLIEAIGMRAARRWCLTGAVFGAAEAAQMGLAHAIYDGLPALWAAGEGLIDDILQCPPEVVGKTKRLLDEMRFRAMDAALLDDLAERSAHQLMTDTAREGIASFLEKRRPHWAE